MKKNIWTDLFRIVCFFLLMWVVFGTGRKWERSFPISLASTNTNYVIRCMEVTAYCPCEKCCGKWSKYKTTAGGHKIQKGDKFCAAGYPFGTMISIPGYNNNEPVPVLDRGKAITNGKLDVYFDDHQEALNWGRKKVNVIIWK